MQLTGIHHVTTVAGNTAKNVEFSTIASEVGVLSARRLSRYASAAS